MRLLGAMLESEGQEPVGVRELARRLDAPPSSLQRTLAAARDASALSTTRDGKWRIGWEMYRIAALLRDRDPFAECQPELDGLARDLDETVVLTVLDVDMGQRMFVACSETRRAVRFVPTLYTWLPAFAGATGMAAVSTLEPSVRQSLFARTPAEALPPRLDRETDLEQTCKAITRDGYALSRDEVDLGASSVAVPVPGGQGAPCALGLIAPAQRFDEPDERTLQRLIGVARYLSTQLGALQHG